MMAEDRALRVEPMPVVVEAQVPLILTASVCHELALGDLHLPLFLHDDLHVYHDNCIDQGLFLGVDAVEMDISMMYDHTPHNSSIVGLFCFLVISG